MPSFTWNRIYMPTPTGDIARSKKPEWRLKDLLYAKLLRKNKGFYRSFSVINS
jgi:hypothetical protein